MGCEFYKVLTIKLTVILTLVQVVLPALVSLSLAQAQLFGPRPAQFRGSSGPRPVAQFRPAATSSNQIVDQVLDELSPTIAQVQGLILNIMHNI